MIYSFISSTQFLTILTGIITGIGTGVFSHYLTSLRSTNELKRQVEQKRLELLYKPLYIHLQHDYQDGLELTEKTADQIIMLVMNNIEYADSKLIHSIEQLQGELKIKEKQDHDFHTDSELYDHVLSEFNQIKKKLLLPYEKHNLVSRKIKISSDRDEEFDNVASKCSERL